MAERGFKLFGTKITPEVRKGAEEPDTGSATATATNSSCSSGGTPPAPAQPQPPAAAAAAAAGAEKATTSGLPCPRCKSRETKFCYFNNYNVNQPRHFCRGCHRYWTAGGALRNVPVGAGRRKARPPSQEEEEGGGGGFGFSAPPPAGSFEGVVVQQWLMSHDGFPAKRRPNAGVPDRIR